MYTVFQQGARCSFYTAVCSVWALAGCSSAPTPQIVPIEAVARHQHRCTKLENASSRIDLCPSRNGAVFVSVVNDCSISEKFTLQATTRQLFVGLTGLKVISQEPVTLGSTQALHSVVQGTVDADPIAMSTFTFRNGNCVRDLVMWRSLLPSKAGHADVETFVDESVELAELLVADNHVAETVSGSEG